MAPLRGRRLGQARNTGAAAMADIGAARNRLIDVVRARSFSTGGETKLVSGRSTSFYFNMKPTMLDPEGGHLIAILVLDALEGASVDLIGGLEMGAVPLATAVAVLSQAKGGRCRPSSCGSRRRSTAPGSWSRA